VEATTSTISSSLPWPTRLEGSGLWRRWTSVAAMDAPADRASSSNSARLVSKSRVEAAWLGGFFSSNDGGRGAGKSSGCGKLFAFAEFSGELDHDDHGKFLLGLRGTEFAGEECRVLGLTCFDETTTDCLCVIPA